MTDKINNFFLNDHDQRKVRDAVLFPYYARTYEHFVPLDGKSECSMLLQRNGADTAVRTKRGRTLYIEEKIVKWPGYQYASICIETESCTLPGLVSPGWACHAKSELLNYCMMEPLCLRRWQFDFQALLPWFWPLAETFREHVMPDGNRTRCRLVPIEQIKAAGISVKELELYIEPTHPLCEELFPLVHQKHLEKLAEVEQLTRDHQIGWRPYIKGECPF